MNQPAFVAMPEPKSVSSSENDQQVPASFDHLPEDLPDTSAPTLPPTLPDALAEFERITQSISAVGAATYHWNIATDKIIWHGDTSQVFSHVDPEKYADGRAFASLLDPDNFTSRFETVMRNHHNDTGDGVPFSIEYSIKPFGRDQEHSIWIEDTGRWYAGPDGRPCEVYGVVRQIDDRHKQDQHLQFLGNCDPLTGMMNRGRLAEALGETIELARTEQHSSGFLIVSVSNLAIVNDAYGFDVADDVISKIGRRLREVVRAGDVIGRCSGSKFGIIMSRATKEELDVAAERFLTVARQRVIETEMGPVWAMLSIGGVVLPNHNEDANLTMSHAEEALTEATRLPTDGVVIYQPSAELVSERKLNSRCAIEIVHGLKENNFTLAYQPIVNAKTKEVEFHEGLLRMKCDNGDIVEAGHLVPISEKLGLVRLIDQLVVFKVLSALRQFPQAKIALNISGVTANDPRWFGKLTEILEENIDITNRLTVEITETVALNDIDQTVRFIEKLHTLGCKIAIDDFGAGFTSFKNLKVLNVDKVKIDGSFCEDISNNQDNQFFVHTLIELSKKFNLEVVAEWIENEADAELLTSWGVDYLQGRLYGMAESQSPWGEMINEEGDICVVPSEILVQDDAENDQDHKAAESDEQMAGEACRHDNNIFESQVLEEGAIEGATSEGAITENMVREDTSLENAVVASDSQQPEHEFAMPDPQTVSKPFEAVIPDDEPVVFTPELNVEVDETPVPTTGNDQQSPVVEEVITPPVNPATEPAQSEQSPLHDELQKLREAIQLFSDEQKSQPSGANA